MRNILIKKQCLNKCGRHVMLKRAKHGVTEAVECGVCKKLGFEKSKLEFLQLNAKCKKSVYSENKLLKSNLARGKNE